MRIFLDDMRVPHDCSIYMERRIGHLAAIYDEKWTVVRDFDAFVKVVTEHIDDIMVVSFDHDLAPEHYVSENWQDSKHGIYEEKTGYDCAKWMKEFYAEMQTDHPMILIHSMNPVGVENIKNVFKKK